MSTLLDEQITEALRIEASTVPVNPNLDDLAERIDSAKQLIPVDGRFGRRSLFVSSVAAASVLLFAGAAAAMLNDQKVDDVRVQMPADSAKSTTTVPKTTVPKTTVPKTTTTIEKPVAPTTIPVKPPEMLAPGLEMVSPKSGSTETVGSTVRIYGRTEKGSELTANGTPVYVNENGEFVVEYKVVEAGLKYFTFRSNKPGGPATEVPFSIKGVAPKVEVPPTTTKPKTENPPVEYSWSAFQTYGSCSEAVPFDVFYGTGKPGTTVKVYSNFGITTTQVNADGNWQVRAEFTGTTPGQTIPLYVKHLATGQFKEFSLTRTA